MTRGSGVGGWVVWAAPPPADPWDPLTPPSPCSVPDSPHEPDPESYEPLPPKLIPLDEVRAGAAPPPPPQCPPSGPPHLIPRFPPQECSEEIAYPEGLEAGAGAASPCPEGPGGAPGGAAKLPPVLANLMGSVGAGKSPQGPAPAPPINMQEILTSIMVTAPPEPDPPGN